jgi:hypothetical protein
MNWRNELQGHYPKLFAAPCEITCGRGWETLLDVACGMLQARIDEGGAPQIFAVQLKQKFGELRFYYHRIAPQMPGEPRRRVVVRESLDTLTLTTTDGGPVDTIIDFARRLSLRTCEVCGAPGTVREAKSGLIMTRCKAHGTTQHTGDPT